MFCVNCGTQLPDEARFCSKCGKAQTEDAQPSNPQQSNVSYEICEIHFTDGGIWNSPMFWASAIGPKGEYTAAKSPPIHSTIRYFGRENQVGWDALNALVEELRQEGWEPVTRTGSESEFGWAELSSLFKSLGKDGLQTLARGKEWYSYRFRRRLG